MKHKAGLKKVVAFFLGMTLQLSCLAMPGLSVDVFADDDTDTEIVADVTDLHWVEGSQATLEWTAAEEADRYIVNVTVYENGGTTKIGSKETGTTDTMIDVQS